MCYCLACFGKQDIYWISFVSGFGFYRRQISKRSTSGYRTFRALVQFRSFELTLGAGVIVYLAPGGQAVPAYLTPHPGYLHPQGASRPGRFILHLTHTRAIT